MTATETAGASVPARRGCALGHQACKLSTEIAAGDVVMFLGSPHLIARVEPHDGPHAFAVGVARAADGWGITLCDTGCTEVASL